jgi:pimeloyl-ACP methyl ester carboxylesterase
MSRRTLVYLHGFASSAQSSKGVALAARASAAGMDCLTPDLNLPEFSSLTISRMLDQVHELTRRIDGPITLIGSSLGAIVALFSAASLGGDPAGAAVDTMVLMAPAVDLVPDLERQFGEAGLHEWENAGATEVFHYAYQEPRLLGWEFFADARRYDPWTVDTPLPTLVFHGRRDEVVDPYAVRRWAVDRETVILHMLDDGHQLSASVDVMWQELVRFLQMAA